MRTATASGFGFRWVLASTGGWFLGFLAAFILASSLEGVLPGGPAQATLAYFALGLGTGGGVGLLQWLVLRRRLPGSGWWIGASAVGPGIAGGAVYALAVLIFGYSEGLEGLGTFGAALGWTLAGTLGGALAGWLQGRVLRPHVARASGWVLPSTLGWGAAFAVFAAVNVLVSRLAADAWTGVMAATFLGSMVLGGLALGAVTGAALSRLVDPPPSG